MTQVCHVAYQSMRLDKTNTMVPVSPLYLQFITSCQNTSSEPAWPGMTSDDLSEGPRTSNSTQNSNGCIWKDDTEGIGVILCVPSEREAFAQFPPLTYNGRGHDIYLTLGHRYKTILNIHFVDNHSLIIFDEFHWSRENCGNGPLSNFFWGEVTQSKLVTWPEMTWTSNFLRICKRLQ